MSSREDLKEELKQLTKLQVKLDEGSLEMPYQQLIVESENLHESRMEIIREIAQRNAK